jgi:hypothetical protein
MKYIAIDPDLHFSGMATMENGQYQELRVISFPDLVDLIREHNFDPNTTFVIEDVNANKPTFSRPGQNAAQMKKIAQNVGMVKGVGKIMIDMLSHHGCKYELVKPLKGLLKSAKNDKGIFQKLTGWTGQSNEDKRDAAMLIHKYRVKK